MIAYLQYLCGVNSKYFARIKVMDTVTKPQSEKEPADGDRWRQLQEQALIYFWE